MNCCITVTAQEKGKGKEIQLTFVKTTGRVFCDGDSSCGNLCLRAASETALSPVQTRGILSGGNFTMAGVAKLLAVVCIPEL